MEFLARPSSFFSYSVGVMPMLSWSIHVDLLPKEQSDTWWWASIFVGNLCSPDEPYFYLKWSALELVPNP